MYDNSLKVPLLVRWPGGAAPGTVAESIISNLAWYATLAEMGGADVPAGVLLRGRSFAPLLRGDTLEDPHARVSNSRMDARRDELFNLVDDPAESVNLIAEDTPEVRAVIEYLDARPVERMTEIDDPALPLAARLTK